MSQVERPPMPQPEKPSKYLPFRPIPNPDNPILVSEPEILSQHPKLAAHLTPIIRSRNNPLLLFIANGGLQFGEDLVGALRSEDPELKFETAVIQYVSRDGVGDTSDKTPILDETKYTYPVIENGRNVFLIDDVADSLFTLSVAAKEAQERGAVVTDAVVAVEKNPTDEFKGEIRKHSLPEGVELHALVQTVAIWLKRYGMDNGVEATAEEDRKGRVIEVNWPFEEANWPEMVAEYRKRFTETD